VVSFSSILSTFASICGTTYLLFTQVSEKKAMEWCSSKGNIPYFETSAKEDRNVDSAFLSVAKLALEHERDQDIYFQTVVPDPVPEAEQRSGCAC
jgi:Ras-related protein Rab-7A